ncbi:hypothetical protein [Acidithiobacillus sp.]
MTNTNELALRLWMAKTREAIRQLRQLEQGMEDRWPTRTKKDKAA